MKLEEKIKELREAIKNSPNDRKLKTQLKQAETMLKRENSLFAEPQEMQKTDAEKLEDLYEQKEKLERFVAKYPDSDELKTEIAEIESQIQILKPDKKQKYFVPGDYNMELEWNMDKQIVTFEDGTSYTEKELMSVPQENRQFIHYLKKEMKMKLSSKPFMPQPEEVKYALN